MSSFTFFIPSKIKFGRDTSKKIEDELKGKRVMIMCDSMISEMPVYKQIKQSLGDKIISAYEKGAPISETIIIDEALAIAREAEIDSVLGIGDVGTLDAAKVISILSKTKEGSSKEYLHLRKKAPSDRTELVLMPFAAGVGSEVSDSAFLYDTEEDIIKPFVSPFLCPDVVIIDPSLMEKVPKNLVASNGFNAFSHAIESFWSTNTNPISYTLALESMDLILKNLKKAYMDQNDKEACDNLAKASLLAGIAFSQTGATTMNSLSYSFMAHYGIESGIAASCTLIPFMKYNVETLQDAFGKAADYCGYQSPEEWIGAVAKLYQDVNMIKKLSEYGVRFKDVDRIVEDSMAQNSVKFNPREIPFEEMKKIIIGII